MSTGLSYEVRVLHAAADGIGPALILSAPKGAAQYLVNVPEGFARLALEHKLRPSARLSCVMLTSLLPQSAVRISTFQSVPNFLGPGPVHIMSWRHRVIRLLLSLKIFKLFINRCLS
jgi:hypothetical protein